MLGSMMLVMGLGDLMFSIIVEVVVYLFGCSSVVLVMMVVMVSSMVRVDC